MGEEGILMSTEFELLTVLSSCCWLCVESSHA
jgi:hypothetical protein